MVRILGEVDSEMPVVEVGRWYSIAAMSLTPMTHPTRKMGNIIATCRYKSLVPPPKDYNECFLPRSG